MSRRQEEGEVPAESPGDAGLPKAAVEARALGGR